MQIKKSVGSQKDIMKKEIFEKLKTLPVIDSHEHLPHERDMLKQTTDVIDFMTPYVCDNLMSCGMSEALWRKANDKTICFAERYELLKKYLDALQDTTYFKSMLKGAALCYGMKDFGLKECERVNSLLNNGIDTCALFEKFHIVRALTFIDYHDTDYFSDSKLLTPVPTVSYITPKSVSDLENLRNIGGVDVTDLDSLSHAISEIFKEYRRCGLKNIKIGAAYNRTLDYTRPDKKQAERQLQTVKGGKFIPARFYGQNNVNIPLAPLKDLDNFVIDRCAACAAEYGMNLIFHTGIHAWNKNDPAACHAGYLTNFIAEHPDQKIVLLHFGYPFVSESLLLSRYYPNVYLDFAWLHTLDRREAVNTVKKAIELLPTNKIVGFGGDVCTPVNTVGNLHMCLENLAQAFSELTQEGEMSETRAIDICYKWLFENPKTIYGVEL